MPEPPVPPRCWLRKPCRPEPPTPATRRYCPAWRTLRGRPSGHAQHPRQALTCSRSDVPQPHTHTHATRTQGVRIIPRRQLAEETYADLQLGAVQQGCQLVATQRRVLRRQLRDVQWLGALSLELLHSSLRLIHACSCQQLGDTTPPLLAALVFVERRDELMLQHVCVAVVAITAVITGRWHTSTHFGPLAHGSRAAMLQRTRQFLDHRPVVHRHLRLGRERRAGQRRGRG